MRTNQKYHLFSGLAILMQFCISKLSLWYFKNISDNKITLIRKQGIGDAVFVTGIFESFIEKYPTTKLTFVTNHPEVFKRKCVSSFGLFDFPMVWLMYEHWDFKLLKGNDQHIKHVIADLIGLKTIIRPYSLPKTDNSILNAFGLIDKEYIVIHPWAGNWNNKRNWDVVKWNELVATMDKKLFCQIGSEQDPLIEGVIDLRGKTTIKESFRIIESAHFFIGVNSFAEQVAATYHISSIILYGATHPIYSLNNNQMAIVGDTHYRQSDLDAIDFQFKDVLSIKVKKVQQAYENFEQHMGL